MTRRHAYMPTLILLLALGWSDVVPAQENSATLAELDATWAEVSRTVAEGDFEAYAAVYHPDAVLVTGVSTTPISDALASWKPGFLETQAGNSSPRVDFRFTRRAHDATTAHETGIFRFTAQAPGSEASVQYVHFEALLVKRDGRWLMLMEYQKSTATSAEWDAAR